LKNNLEANRRYAFPALCQSPHIAGETEALELIVYAVDSDEHFAIAKAAGAEILIEPKDKP